MTRERRRPGNPRRTVTAVTVLGGLLLPLAALGQQASYTAAQATEGMFAYQESCAACHGNALEGGTAPQLAGANFRNSWGARPVASVLEYLRSTMPPGAEGSLPDGVYAAIAAFIMRENQVEPGAAPLGLSSEGGFALAEGAVLVTDGTPPRPGIAGSVPPPEGRNSVPDYGVLSETSTGATRTYRAAGSLTPVSDDELRDPPEGEWLTRAREPGLVGLQPAQPDQHRECASP